ncbi:Hydroxyquinol 1,2-dioxygenase (1,2-HQD) [Sphingopyxis fribergensis]|uniref:Hydroxyquinol 1,2-dioxygenase (1,2-HQD) n=1 Tax=Sphingopyxis fribergensis TaxID=1515612 RepID=A0A0A7PHM4_9SPHN|nr:dioxygenase [Sphingopyxis fribergensis]AJA09489.1 Hydroxyquinol 1,2-dioxygenase (1,2-HQD) [Sphingopyxis fribergensis]
MLDVNEETITKAVTDAIDRTPDDRTRRIMQSLVTHLHAFVRDIEPSDAEWFAAIDFLTRTGQMCSDVRQEFILLSDTLGVTTLVDAINHRYPSGATVNSVLGPFYYEGRPSLPNGSDISGKAEGVPLIFKGSVRDTQGNPVADAAVDVWHSDAEGHYDMMLPGFGEDETAMRASLRTGADGQFWFRSVMPASYPIPDDGPVGAMMRATHRSNMRPGHVHVMIDAPGSQKLTTMVFVAGDPFVEADPVFGVKRELIQDFHLNEGGVLPDGTHSDETHMAVEYVFTVAPAATAAA